MKERLINNLVLKILSIFLAFLVWLVVVNVSNPEVTRTKEVPLDIENEQVLLTANRTYETNVKNAVTVSYTIRTRDEYKIKASDFRAYIDLTELYDITGSVPIRVEILNNKEVITSASARPGVVRVQTEDLQRKRFELEVKLPGEPADGFKLDGWEVNPEYIYVEGPVSKVGLISSVGLEIRVDGASGDLSGTTAPIFYDANGNDFVLSDRIHVDTEQVEYYVTLNKDKRLILDFDVVGTVASGYRYVGVESDVQTVAVNGSKSSLATINKIIIPAAVLNLDGATADKIVRVNLQDYLPEGVEIAQSENSLVNIVLKVEQLQTRTFTVQESDIQKSNTSEDKLYRIQPKQLEVVLQGLGDDLNSLQVTDLGAEIDVASLEDGSHRGVLTFNYNTIFTVVSYSDFTIDVIPRINMEASIEGSDDHSQDAGTASAQESAEREEDNTTEAESISDPMEGSATG